MEAELAHLLLDSLPFSSILQALENGEILSEQQRDGFYKLIKLERYEKEISEAFRRSPERVLQSIERSWNLVLKSGDLKPADEHPAIQELFRVAEYLSRFVATENYESVTELCIPKLSQDHLLHLYLYTNTAMKYCEKRTEPVGVLLPLLSNQSHVVVLRITLTLFYFLKKIPSCDRQIAASIERILKLDASDVSKNDFMFVCTVFKTFLPVIPQRLVPQYCSEACKNLFLFRGPVLDPDHYLEDTVVAEKLLTAIAVSCFHEEARKFNSLHYSQFLIAGTKVQTSRLIVALSCLCLVKIWDFAALDLKIPVLSILAQVVEQIKQCKLSDRELDPLIEALTYLTLSASFRTVVRNDKELLDIFLSILDTTKISVIKYGVLTILSHLTKLSAPSGSADEETRTYLKSMADAQKNSREADDALKVAAFNKEMVTTGLLARLVLQDSNSVLPLVVQIIYNLTIRQKHDVLSKIGHLEAPDTLLTYLLDHSAIDKDSGGTINSSDNAAVHDSRASAIRALAAISRAVNPKKLFDKYKTKIAVPFLLELLHQHPAKPFQVASAPEFNALDLLVGLLALTNLCLLQDSELQGLVVQKAFDRYLAELIFDPARPDIQKAAWELVNNLIGNRYMLAKFFNPENTTSKKNLCFLVKFLNSEDPALQKIIAGLLANATSEYALVVSSIVSDTAIFQELLVVVAQILNEQALDSALMYRVGVFLYNLSQSDQAVTILRNNATIKASLVQVLKCGDLEVCRVFVEFIQAVYKS